MFRPAAPLLAMALVACASAPPSPQSWEGCGCSWLEQQARELAGPGMIDCGFVNVIAGRSRAELRAGMRCARRAFGRSAAFRFGSVRIPIDSYATEVLVRRADGSLWLLVHDVMIDGEAPQFWVQRCEKVRFKADYSGFMAEGCRLEEAAKS
jgi:hypothetical protein